MKQVLVLLFGLALVACQPASEPGANEGEEAAAEPVAAQERFSLADVLDAQPDEMKARYPYRHPRETLEFFGIEPGMTVLEGLPGQGWYSKILVPYLGKNGRLLGADYSMEMYPNFGFATEEYLEKQAKWTTNFPADAAQWGGDNGASVEAFNFGSMPEEYRGVADAAFLPRVLHNLARFESEGGYLSSALADIYVSLKPGGVLGVVQHHARDDMSDEFANGGNGYLKKAFVIARIEQAGFEFVGESDINANPNDQPTEDDIVWRLPPTLGTSRDNAELRAELEAIGESNRMTLLFRKPE